MMKVFLPITALLLLSNCDPATYTIHINNQSGKVFDSVVVLIASTRGNNTTIKFTDVWIGQNINKNIDASIIDAKHDIAIAPTLCAKGTVIKYFGCYNDLGVFMANYQISIDSALQVRCKEWY